MLAVSGNYLAIIDSDTTVRVFDTSSSSQTADDDDKGAPAGSYYYHTRYPPNKNKSSSNSPSLHVHALHTRKPQSLADELFGTFDRIVVSPDERYVACLSASQQAVFVLEIASGTCFRATSVQASTVRNSNVYDVAFSPDSNYIAFTQGRFLCLFELAHRVVVKVLAVVGEAGKTSCVAWSPCKKWLVVGYHSNLTSATLFHGLPSTNIAVISVLEPQKRRFDFETPLQVEQLFFASATGRHLCARFAFDSEATRIWDFDKAVVAAMNDAVRIHAVATAAQFPPLGEIGEQKRKEQLEQQKLAARAAFSAPMSMDLYGFVPHGCSFDDVPSAALVFGLERNSDLEYDGATEVSRVLQVCGDSAVSALNIEDALRPLRNCCSDEQQFVAAHFGRGTAREHVFFFNRESRRLAGIASADSTQMARIDRGAISNNLLVLNGMSKASTGLGSHDVVRLCAWTFGKEIAALKNIAGTPQHRNRTITGISFVQDEEGAGSDPSAVAVSFDVGKNLMIELPTMR